MGQPIGTTALMMECQRVVRTPASGNGVCEIGERLDAPQAAQQAQSGMLLILAERNRVLCIPPAEVPLIRKKQCTLASQFLQVRQFGCSQDEEGVRGCSGVIGREVGTLGHVSSLIQAYPW